MYSIVIPAYNEEDLLPNTLESVLESMQSTPGYNGELIVVDNNSTDATSDIARRLGARVVFEKHNQISRARNAGGFASSGEFIIFVDADTTISPALLKETLQVLKQDNVCGGGASIAIDRKLSLVFRFVVASWNTVAKWFKLAAGSYLFCRRDGFVAVEGFDEQVYAGEDALFSRAIKKWGREHDHSVFKILDIPVVTSARKMEQYSFWILLKQHIRAIFFPWTARDKDDLSVWYRR